MLPELLETDSNGLALDGFAQASQSASNDSQMILAGKSYSS